MLIGLKKLKKWSLDKFRQVWTSLDKFKQVQTSLDKFQQVYVSFNKLNQVLNQFEKSENQFSEQRKTSAFKKKCPNFITQFKELLSWHGHAMISKVEPLLFLGNYAVKDDMCTNITQLQATQQQLTLPFWNFCQGIVSG